MFLTNMYPKNNLKKQKMKLDPKPEKIEEKSLQSLHKSNTVKIAATFTRRSSLRIQRRKKFGQFPSKEISNISFRKEFQCQKCDKKLTSRITLVKHIAQRHPEEVINYVNSTGNPKQCTKCQRKFISKRALIGHTKRYHSTTNVSKINKNIKSTLKQIFECAKCSTKFSFKKTLIRHIRQFHKGDIFDDSVHRAGRKTIKCLECSVMFSRKTSLRRHERKFHPHPEQDLNDLTFSPKIIPCSKCAAMFSRKSNLRRHEKKFHYNPEEPQINNLKRIECASCASKFTTKRTLIKHIRRFHPDIISPRCVVPTEKKIIPCPNCPVMFSRKPNLLRHEKKFHPEKYDQNTSINQVSRKPVQCPVCKKTFNKKTELLEHFSIAHDITLQEEFFAFDNETEFKKWKISVEEETKCNYMIRHSVSHEDYKKVIFRCSRSGYYETKAQNRQRRLKEKGSKKINGYCPAEMNVKIFNQSGIVQVHHQATHVGHTNELKYMDLNEEERNIIINSLAAGIPVNALLQKFRINVSTPLEDRKRLHLINKKEIRNIAHRAGVYNMSSKVQVKEDPVSVEEWVQMNRHFVLYFKWKDTFDSKFPFLNVEDFVLIIMTNAQCEKLHLYGNNVLYFDCTHGLNQYNFQLSALMVLNDMEKEYPCSFMFSNKMDESVYYVFIESIKEKIPSLHPEIIMTDITESFYDSWIQIMPEPEFRLYCTWHVLKDWKANLTKIQALDVRKEVFRTLDDLLHVADEECFKSELNTFMEAGQGYDEFQKYIMDEYLVKRSPKHWAHCYRFMANIKLSMNLEAFHKNIKYRIHGGKKVKCLDEALLGLEKYLTEKEHEDVLIQEGCMQPPNQSGYRLRILRKRHQEMRNINVENIECIIENEVWFLTSSTTIEIPKGEENLEKNILTIYSIERTYTDCKVYDCMFKCEECNACIHNFKCSCEDCVIKNNMCKHIHLICQYIKIHTPEFLFSLNSPEVSSTEFTS